jgi:phosphonatase-like hydrolase
MRHPRLDLFVFDLAGTTIRDDGHVLRCLRRVADAEGLAAEDRWLTQRMGVYKLAVFQELLELNGHGPERAGGLSDAFEHAMQELVRLEPLRPLAGAVETIERLEGAGVRVAFNTGFTTPIARLWMGSVGWGERTLVASDQVARGRPAPDMILEAMRRCGATDPARVGVAGDTPSDLRAGTAAGCGMVVGVGHGTHTLSQLAADPHTLLLPDLTGLCAAIGDAGAELAAR